MKKCILLINILLTIASISYPIVWLFFEKNSQNILYLTYSMVGLWLAKSYFQSINWQRYLSIFVAVILLLVAIVRTTNLMYWYPILINSIMLFIFGSSLLSKQSIIEKFARLRTPDLPNSAILYTRKVTQIWCAFFVVNIAITAGLILSNQFYYWAIYTGILSYILMAILILGEWLVRKRIIHQHN